MAGDEISKGSAGQADDVIERSKVEVLSWVSAIGASVTVLSNIEGFIRLGRWARWLQTYWDEAMLSAWRYVFGIFKLEVSKTEATYLTLSAFIIGLTIAARRTDFHRPSVVRVLLLGFGILFAMFAMLFAAGSFPNHGRAAGSIIFLVPVVGAICFGQDGTYQSRIIDGTTCFVVYLFFLLTIFGNDSLHDTRFPPLILAVLGIMIVPWVATSLQAFQSQLLRVAGLAIAISLTAFAGQLGENLLQNMPSS